MSNVIDRQALENHFKELPGDLIKQVVQIFIEDYPQQVEDIQTMINNKDPEGLKKAAHSFKGMLRSLYATEMAAMGQELEALGLEGNFKESQKKLDEMKNEIPRVLEVLNEYT